MLLACVAISCSPAAPPPARPAPAAGARTFPVRVDVQELLADDAGFARFASALRADIEQRLGHGRSSTAVRKADLFDLAILDALDGNWERAVGHVGEVIALERDPAMRAMAGLTIRVWADARRSGGDPAAAFGAALDRAIAAMPYELVREQLAILGQMGQVFTLDTCKSLVAEALGPDAADGALTRESASALLFQRYAVLHLAPVGKQIVEAVSRAGAPR